LQYGPLGVFDRIFAALAGKGPQPERIMIDATHLKAHRIAASLLGREPINANGYLIFATTYRRFQIVTDVLAVQGNSQGTTDGLFLLIASESGRQAKTDIHETTDPAFSL